MKIPPQVIKKANEAAHFSTHKFRVSAVVYNKKGVLSYGWNKANKTHPRSNTPYSTIHAEFDAVARLEKHQLKDASIYIHRIRRDGLLGLAAPCSYCKEFLAGVGIQRIIYSRDPEM